MLLMLFVPINQKIGKLPRASSENIKVQNLDEIELVRRCIENDRDALELLFDKYYKDVYRMTVRFLGYSQDIDDVVQSVMLEVHRSLKNFKGKSKLSSWIFRIAMNVSNQHLRKLSGTPYFNELDNEQIAAPQNAALHNLELQEKYVKLHEILLLMPKKKREIFVLAELEELNSEQMSEILGCSISAVWSRLHQARKLFWEKVEQQGYFDNTKSGKQL